MKNTISQSTAGFLSLERKQAINVAIVYEDYATGLRAKRLYDTLCRQLEPECEVNQSMWKFEVLSIPHLGAVAAEEAAEADLILISLRGDRDLPHGVKDWMETWAGEKAGQSSALVALFGEIEENESQIDTIQTQLRQVARRSEMSFFAEPAGSPSWDSGHSPDRIRVHSEAMSPVWADVIDNDPTTRHWGINE